MSTSPTRNLRTGTVTFTARGEAALDDLAASLASGCDGSPASIADILEQVLDTGIEQLADSLNAADEGRDAATPRPTGLPERAVAPHDRPRTIGP